MEGYRGHAFALPVKREKWLSLITKRKLLAADKRNVSTMQPTKRCAGGVQMPKQQVVSGIGISHR